MRRSDINSAIDQAVAFFSEMKFPLPDYAYWSSAEWDDAGPDYGEVRDLGLGWDVTDFGSGNLEEIGRTLFTLRNGSSRDSRYPKTYSQKAMCMPEGQKSIIHYHRSKMEDICNQGGGVIAISLWKATSDDQLSDQELDVTVSGVRRRIRGGDTIRLEPGESVCVVPNTFHQFWAEDAMTLGIEVSSVCDDHTDNFFYGKGERFPAIVEDEERRHVLCSEYYG